MDTQPVIPVRRALLSVSDKTDLVPFARALASHNVEIISTGGTARALIDAGINVTAIDELTGFPEIMDGRVKTLHPKVHGGLLARRDVESHVEAMNTHGIQPIDLVCVNLYPFEQTVAKGADVSRDEIIEQIDIGGPSMIRSAAKNHEFVAVVTSPKQYDRVVTELDQYDGGTSYTMRAELAASAFSRTAEYDATIAAWMHRRTADSLGDQLQVNFTKALDLRYGENPHQQAALYRDPASVGPTVVNATVLHGKALSYNNLNDGAAALALAREFSEPTACVIKHTNACGAGTASNLHEAFLKAYAGDPLAAYGGILAMNRPVDVKTANAIADGQKFFEVIIAPTYDEKALAVLQERWTNVRILEAGDSKPSQHAKIEYRSIPGGMLVQQSDQHGADVNDWLHVAGPEPDAERVRNAAFVWLVCKHLKSNAIALGGGGQLFGMGAGQVDRVTAARLAVEKAGDKARGAIACSDAFFPFKDGPELLIDSGVSMIVHPGGSKRDQETFDLCNERGITCMTTGIRHFRH